MTLPRSYQALANWKTNSRCSDRLAAGVLGKAPLCRRSPIFCGCRRALISATMNKTIPANLGVLMSECSAKSCRIAHVKESVLL